MTMKTADGKQIKRLRVSQVCLSCKKRKVKCDRTRPKCSNCVKFGVVNCEYSEIKWVNDNQKQDIMKTELESLRRELERYRQLSSGSNPAEHMDVYIDFYKHSSGGDHEISRPLEFSASLRRDPYIHFFTCYMMLTRKFNFQVETDRRNMDEWMVFLDTNNEDSSLRKSLNLLKHDREILLEYSDEKIDFDEIRRGINSILPIQAIINEYLNFFFRYVHPLRPFLNEAEFKSKLNTYFISDQNLSYSNLLFVAILLVVLRYTHIAIQLMDTQHRSDINMDLLLTNPIKVECVNFAKRILSTFNLSKAPTFELLQLLLFLNSYFEDCPEDGNAVGLDQPQTLFGLLFQISLNLGLNKDSNDDLRRILWFSLLNMNASACITAGNVPMSLDPDSVNVKYVASKDVMNSAINHEFVKEKKLNDIHIEISKTINSVSREPNFLKLTKLLDEAGDYITEVYNFNKFLLLDPYITGSQSYLTAALNNVKILSKHLIHSALEIQVYAAIFNHAESKSHLNIELYKEYYMKALKTTTKIRDLIAGYVRGNLRKYIDDVHNFEVLPYLHKCLQRCSIFTLHSTFRLYHALEVKVNDPLISEFINAISVSNEFGIDMYKNCHAKKYYNAIVLFSTAKYSNATMKRYKFRSLGKVIKFLENIKTNKSTYHDSMIFNFYKEWIPSNNNSIVNINNTNFFIEGLQPEFIKECILIWENNFFFCPEFPELLKQSKPDPLSLNGNSVIRNAMEVTHKEMETSISEENTPTSDLDPVELDLKLFDHIFKDLDNFGDLDTFLKDI